MGRKKKQKEKDNQEESHFTEALKKETLEAIIAIVFIIVSIFLLLSPFDKAGIVGDKTYQLLDYLFGIGYYLLPLILIILGVSFIKSLNQGFGQNLAWPKILGGFIFIFSGIGIIHQFFEKGGIVGGLIVKPLEMLFEQWVTSVTLIGLLTISILVIFDTSLKFSFIRKLFGIKDEVKDENQLDEEEEKNFNEIESRMSSEQKDDEEEIPVVNKKPEPEEKKSTGLVFFSKKSKDDEIYQPPPLSLLEKDSGKPGVGDIKANANIIKRTLSNFGIQVEMDEVSIGPSVTRYALKPAEGVKLSKIVALQNDLSLALAAHPIRIEAPIPGKSLVGIEIPNSSKTTVGLGTLLKQANFQDSPKPLTLALGKGVSGESTFADLAKMPHMLIAGTTGSGKSVTIHALVTSLLYRNAPDALKFIMVDPKRVELTQYNKIPHLLTPVITDAKKTILSLKWAAKEMSRRYDILEKYGKRDIASYHKSVLEPAIKNKKGDEELPDSMPYIVIIIDELADIMQAYPRELEAGIVRLAQMSRAVGIHLIISTQRPSVNVITGLIKANIPARVALQVSSQIDSRTILDMPGAEKLLGAGDMLYLSGDIAQPIRIQSAFITEEEVGKVVKYLSNNYRDELPESEIDLENAEKDPNPLFDSIDEDEDDEEDDLYEEAKEIVVSAGKASTSYLQRKLRIGYSRAARIMDILENKGVIGPADGAKPREVIGAGDSSNSEEEY